MSENPATLTRQHDFERHSRLVAASILLLGFFARLWKASGTFLNLDEAMHFLAANKLSLAEAYRASLGLAHPPLLILLLHVWRRVGSSELVLRLPSVIAGTIFCWIFFKWLTQVLGPAAGWTGLFLVSFLPPFIELSSEVRQYALLLCFLMAALYALELALAKHSAGKMLLVFVFLWLSMLTHFSAILFAAAVGIYSLWRVKSDRIAGNTLAVWITGQAGTLCLFAYLYRTQIGHLKESADAAHMQVLLSNSYFHPGQGNVLLFAFARTFGVFQYTFGQLAVGDIAGVLFIVAVLLLLRNVGPDDRNEPSGRQLGAFLVLPFVITCVAAIVDLYPYGGTRHSAFLVPFALAGVSYAIAKFSHQKIAYAAGGAVLVALVCQLFGSPHRPYMRREDQNRANMTQAIDAIRSQVSPGEILFVDFQTNFLLRFYLCPEAGAGAISSAGLKEYSCGGYRVIATSSDTNVLTADIFGSRWKQMVSAYDLKPGQTVWIFQAGWDANLARQLPERLPEFHDLKPQLFGRNVSLFKWTVATGS
jgi:hypothetical protein